MLSFLGGAPIHFAPFSFLFSFIFLPFSHFGFTLPLDVGSAFIYIYIEVFCKIFVFFGKLRKCLDMLLFGIIWLSKYCSTFLM